MRWLKDRRVLIPVAALALAVIPLRRRVTR
jgi:hypothetical protein